ncbi:putative oxidoreductase [Pseudochelatococcus lubricantis]|uniref:Oxidoreductase n=1 Tax=Pseudochelatococcus lubricantis TaxID=1538102 RepID=A0ABX0UUM9_9HYPH|nr:DoxX family protein [Pseudochelatococcus lubricantis]NIJ56672.1 putative oxidoreductase [Pseudochelatococcus lubricantis]
MSLIATLDNFRPKALAVLRIASSLFFLQHGLAKLIRFPYVEQLANVPLLSQFGIGGIIEVVGSVLILIGLYTRAAAFVLSGLAAVAYFQFHSPHSFFPILNGGELVALFSFVFFYLIFAGPGAWSLDGRRGEA